MFFDNNEAILFRLLCSFFGKDRVIPQMSLSAVCGDRIKQQLNFCTKSAKCLFTIVNEEDSPCLIVELSPENKDSLDIKEFDKQQTLKKILPNTGIQYITLSKSDFRFVTEPGNPDNWFLFLKDKIDLSSDEFSDSH